MFGYIVRRLFAALLVLLLLTMFVFALFFLGPKNPAQPICDAKPPCSPEKLANIEKAMGLDMPVTEAYREWLKGIFVGRTVEFSAAETYECSAPCLGISYTTRVPVTEELGDKIPATLSLAIGAATIYLVVGVIVGTIAARYRGSAVDKGLVASTLTVSSIPYYVVALLAWIFLTQKYPVFETTAYTPLLEDPRAWAAAMMLPWLVLGLTTATSYSRYTRGQMVETLGEDYIRTAVAKGQKGRTVLLKHGLRAAIIPVVTIFGLDFGALLGGAIVTETIFGIDGIGRWGLQAIGTPTNIPVVAATVLVGAFFIVTANLLVDIVYSFLDPRVRLT